MNNEYDNEYDNVMRDADAMLTREYQRASRAAAQAEDNYTMPNRTIAEYLELGYTISYAKSLVSRAEAEQADRLRRNVYTSELRLESIIDSLEILIREGGFTHLTPQYDALIAEYNDLMDFNPVS